MPYLQNDAGDAEHGQAKRKSEFRQIQRRRQPKLRSQQTDRAYQLVCRHLDEGHPEAALHVINGCPLGSTDVELRNAKGVCFLRLGKPELAVPLYRSMVLTSYLSLRDDAPAPVKRNFATALLLNGKVAGCLDVLKESGDDSAPMTQTLRSEIERWKQELSWRERIVWAMGAQPDHPFTPSFVPGELL